MIKKLTVHILQWKFLVYAFALFSVILIPQGDPFFFVHQRFREGLPYLAWIWGSFDGQHYLEIAERGYQDFEQPFFPFFPILIRLTTTVSRLPLIISAQVVSHISFFLALFFAIKLLVLDGKRKLIPLFLSIVIVYPTSFYYGAVYNDSLFLLLATLSLYFARRKQWGWASIAGFFATLTRLNGLALFFFILFEYLTTAYKSIESQWSVRNILKTFKELSLSKVLQSKAFTALLVPCAFIGYYLYTQFAFAKKNMLFSTMKIWDMDKIVLPPQVFWRYAKILFLNPPYEFTYWVAVLELSFTCFYIFLLIWSFKKIRFSYWIFFLISILIPMLRGAFSGMPRYGLHLFPVFLIIALFFQQKSLVWKVLYFTASIVMLFLLTGLFTRGYFIS